MLQPVLNSHKFKARLSMRAAGQKEYVNLAKGLINDSNKHT